MKLIKNLCFYTVVLLVFIILVMSVLGVYQNWIYFLLGFTQLCIALNCIIIALQKINEKKLAFYSIPVISYFFLSILATTVAIYLFTI